jgi:hypothetical protein
VRDHVKTPTADGKNDDAVTLEKGELHLIKFIFHKLIHAGMDHIEAFVRERQSKLEKSGTSTAAVAVEGKSESETKPESELEGEGDAMRLVEELKHVMQALGKPPRSLRKYRDIVFYADERHQPNSAHKRAHDHIEAKKTKKKLKKSKKEEKKKAKKEKKSATKPRGISRLGGRSRGKADNGLGDAVGNKWKSDSCSKVSLVERSSSKRDLKFDSIVRRVRSSDQRTDDGVAVGDDDVEGVEGGVISSGGDGGTESEEGVMHGGLGVAGGSSDDDDDSYSSDFFDESEDEPESPLSSTPSRLNPLYISSHACATSTRHTHAPHALQLWPWRAHDHSHTHSNCGPQIAEREFIGGRGGHREGA